MLSVGQEVEVKVIDVDVTRRRVSPVHAAGDARRRRRQKEIVVEEPARRRVRRRPTCRRRSRCPRPILDAVAAAEAARHGRPTPRRRRRSPGAPRLEPRPRRPRSPATGASPRTRRRPAPRTPEVEAADGGRAAAGAEAARRARRGGGRRRGGLPRGDPRGPQAARGPRRVSRRRRAREPGRPRGSPDAARRADRRDRVREVHRRRDARRARRRDPRRRRLRARRGRARHRRAAAVVERFGARGPRRRRRRSTGRARRDRVRRPGGAAATSRRSCTPRSARLIAEGIAGEPRHRPRRRAGEPAADRDGHAPRLRLVVVVVRRSPETQVARAVARGAWTRTTCAPGSPRSCRSRSARPPPTSCSTTRGPSTSSRRRSTPLWERLGATGPLSRAAVSCRPCGSAPSSSTPGRRSCTRAVVPGALRRGPRASRAPSDRPTTSSRPRAACSTGSARPRATGSCGPPRRSGPPRSGPASTSGCSTSLGVADADGLRDTLYATFTDLRELRAVRRRRAGAGRRSPGPGRRSASCRTSRRGSRISSRDLGVRDRFPVRVISGLEGIEKPDPRIFQLRARARGRRRRGCRVRRRQPGVRRGPAAGARDDAGPDRPAGPLPRPRRAPDRRPPRPAAALEAHRDRASLHARRRTPSSMTFASGSRGSGTPAGA